MNNTIDEIATKETALIRKILDGNIGKDAVCKEIEKLEKQYGENAFLLYIIKKKEKPWDEKYLKALEIQSMAGAASKDFILHLAEVSEAVYKKKRLKKAVLIGVIVLALAAIITTLVLIANKAIFTAAAIVMAILFLII